MSKNKVMGVLGVMVSLALPGVSQADVFTFNFTGRMSVAMGTNIVNGGGSEYEGYQTPISASLTYDTLTGLGASPLSITVQDVFFGAPATIHDISLVRIGDSSLFEGNFLVDWSASVNMNSHIEWDATGFLNAIDSGTLQVGDKISGDVLLRDANGDGEYDRLDPAEVVIASLGSAAPYTDSLIASTGVVPQLNAPLAATANTRGFYGGTPFDNGVAVYLDIGSGNSMYVTAITSVPEAETYAMLLAGLGLVGAAARRRRYA